ncbi:MAG TPA: hypothetical protein VH437_05595 [Terriglobales bacterium]|jgi:hypothetical protein
MKLLLALCTLAITAIAQTSVTVPVTLDHNRIIIDVRVPMPDGSTTRVRTWVDNGNPEMWITERMAKKLGLTMSGEVKDENGLKIQTAAPPQEIRIGTLAIRPSGIKEMKVVVDRTAIGPGMSAEINLPSKLLRHYDVLVDYPNREFTIGLPGSIHFAGTTAQTQLNSENGLVQIATDIGGVKGNLALDFGASYSFLASDVLAKLASLHPEWPQMTGAVGAANMWGTNDEIHAQLLRIDQLRYGSLTLSQVGMESLSESSIDWYRKRAGISTIGFLGANAFLRYRVGIDYAHSTAYFDRMAKSETAAMEVVGLILRPEPDERYTIAGVAEYEGQSSVPDAKAGDKLVKIDGVDVAGGTMGQAWSLLGGTAGETRLLTLERDEKQLTVKAPVEKFLATVSGKAGAGTSKK